MEHSKIMQPQISPMLLFLFILIQLFGCSGDSPDSFLDDRAGFLTDQEQEHLVRYNKALLNDLDIHFKLVILKEKALDINDRAAEIFGNLGQKTRSAKGLLFLVDPIGEQVRIEVGYDLEPVFPDAFVSYLERAQMVPFFKAGKVGSGIEATTELFVTRAQNEIEGKAFDPEKELQDLTYFSGGGGARIKTGISTGQAEKQPSPDRSRFQPGNTPQETLQLYKKALEMHIKDPELPLFTPETRKFFSNWVVTDAQQDNELRSLEKAPDGQLKISGTYAVLRHPIKSRTHSPYFFTQNENGWMLDFATMSKVLQMNHKNMWMMRKTDHPYMFGFSDWTFDTNGFPIGER